MNDMEYLPIKLSFFEAIYPVVFAAFQVESSKMRGRDFLFVIFTIGMTRSL